MHLDLIPSSSDNPSLKGNEGEGQFVDQPDEEFRMIDDEAAFTMLHQQQSSLLEVPVRDIQLVLQCILQAITGSVRKQQHPLLPTVILNQDKRHSVFTLQLNRTGDISPSSLTNYTHSRHQHRSNVETEVEEQAEERDVKAEEPTIKKDPAKMEQTAEQAISSNTSHTLQTITRHNHMSSPSHPTLTSSPALYEFSSVAASIRRPLSPLLPFVACTKIRQQSLLVAFSSIWGQWCVSWRRHFWMMCECVHLPLFISLLLKYVTFLPVKSKFLVSLVLLLSLVPTNVDHNMLFFLFATNSLFMP
ncbi:hypothetical protein BLNAU_25248 [Blattamonas nauphoetae]|uniref:Uncharacterized protein n=1 Tax=Blattamonas nauphoetae TaxID=2049346 RepID=A0ABQ9WK54_9EUKA|nr:hypothetical protein BLNAU_25248 [Blattamonas nauphoetae]